MSIVPTEDCHNWENFGNLSNWKEAAPKFRENENAWTKQMPFILTDF